MGGDWRRGDFENRGWFDGGFSMVELVGNKAGESGNIEIVEVWWGSGFAGMVEWVVDRVWL